MTTTTATDLIPLARGLAHRYRDMFVVEGPKAKAIASAGFDGMCSAVSLLGIGMTPMAVYMVVQDAVNALGPRPGYEPSRNAAQKAHDSALAERIAAGLAAL